MDETSNDIRSEPYEAGLSGERARSDKDIEDIRTEIERTRSEIGETLNAIQERLAPERLSREVKARVREATTGRAKRMAGRAMDKSKGVASSIADAVRNNPLPAAVAGLGLGWLIVKARQASPDGEGREEYYEVETEGRSMAEETARKANESYGAAQENVSKTLGKVKAKGSEMMSTAKEKMKGVTGTTREKMNQLRPKLREQADKTKARFQKNLEERPLALAAGALILGTIFGLSVPKTQKEEEITSSARQRFMQKVNEVRSGVLHS